MAFAEYINIAQKVDLAANGSPGDSVIIPVEVGAPYRHLAMFLHGQAANVTAQPLFGGANDGAATAVAGAIAQKIFQMTVDEIRPPTNGLPNDVIPLKSELQLTNGDANPATLNVFITGSAAPGGA